MRFVLATALLISFGSIVYAQPTLSKPEQLFEKFWKEFDENYALFEVKAIDWQETYTTYHIG